jgi:hypothetical protein
VETRAKLTAIHLVDVLIENRLSAADDPSWRPRVRCAPKRDPSGWTTYEPVSYEAIPRALLELVKDDKRPSKPGAAKAQPGKPRKALYQPAAAVLGKLLARLDQQSNAGGTGVGSSEAASAASLLATLETELGKLLWSLNDGTQEALARMLTILHELSAFYPKVLLLDACWFAHHVQRLLTKVYGLARVQVCSCSHARPLWRIHGQTCRLSANTSTSCLHVPCPPHI